MDLFRVELVAEGIDVTASDSSEAERHANSDAREFMGQWMFEQEDASPVDPGTDLTEDQDDIEVEVTCVEEEEGDDERNWTFEAKFTLVVEAPNAIDAIEKAKQLVNS